MQPTEYTSVAVAQLGFAIKNSQSLAMDASSVILTSESRLFHLSFGWIDLAFSVLFYIYLMSTRRRNVLIAGNLFGLFAFFCDYAVYYLLQGTRTMTYLNGSTPMSPVENFFFFFWFDWINGADIVMWALVVCEDILGDKRRKTPLDYLTLAFVPAWFWATPPLSRILTVLDSRFVLAARPSEKNKYIILLVLFATLLLFHLRLPLSSIFRIFLSGVGCGLIHHAPLFFFKMRGYSSAASLAVTLLTEWPSIICGLFYVTYLCIMPSDKGVKGKLSSKDQPKSKNLFLVFLCVVFLIVAILLPKSGYEDLLKPDKALYKMLPYMSASLFQRIGTMFVWGITCTPIKPLFRTANLDCFSHDDDNNDLLVMAASAKGGAILSAKLSIEIGRACGVCVGYGQRYSDAWPNPVETVPEYDSKILMAIANMEGWPTYAANKNSHCVVVTRAPLSRLRSLYLYSRLGGEKWFRDEGISAKLESLSLEESVAYFLSAYGKEYLIRSHQYLSFNLQQGCHPVKFENMKTNFNETVKDVLYHWQINPAVVPKLVELVQHENPLFVESGGDHHVTSNAFTKEFINAVNSHFLADVNLAQLIKAQEQELGY